ncbi:hypothetical protein EAF04_010281 [Stromatinia cepivora]|nr:hypothetical protein EAF04_010281 [Stromatinia cepivora]
MGGMNYHARIRFDDGSPSWLLRIPRVGRLAFTHPPSFVEYLLLSQYATLKFLETTSVPAPRAFSYGIWGTGTEIDYGVGVSFILMEELRGTAYIGDGPSGEAATESERAKVWNGLADILMELEKHPFTKAGSLCFKSSEIEVSAVSSDMFVILTPKGPFDTSIAYFTAWSEQYLELIADVSQEESQEPEKFYLKHVDDKGDHFLVDEQLNITGVIDWQMACIVPRNEAFGPSIDTVNMKDLCSGKFSLSPDDLALADILHKRGFSGLPGIMDDEKIRRYFWGLANEPKWEDALPLANALLKAFGREKIGHNGRRTR